MTISRRHLLRSGAFIAATPFLKTAVGLPLSSTAHAQPAAAAEAAWTHSLSLFGDVKYPADFKRFDYVNPDAPKGGAVRRIAVGTFDNFNPVVAGVKGSLGAIGDIFEPLTIASLDEVSTQYGLLAEAMSCCVLVSIVPPDLL